MNNSINQLARLRMHEQNRIKRRKNNPCHNITKDSTTNNPNWNMDNSINLTQVHDYTYPKLARTHLLAVSKMKDSDSWRCFRKGQAEYVRNLDISPFQTDSRKYKHEQVKKRMKLLALKLKALGSKRYERSNVIKECKKFDPEIIFWNWKNDPTKVESLIKNDELAEHKAFFTNIKNKDKTLPLIIYGPKTPTTSIIHEVSHKFQHDAGLSIKEDIELIEAENHQLTAQVLKGLYPEEELWATQTSIADEVYLPELKRVNKQLK